MIRQSGIRPAIFIFALMALCASPVHAGQRRPNILFIIADQWRAEAFGYAGNKDVRTPNIDRLAGESCNLVNAISMVPVCSPTRASLLTGQRPLTHGVFINDAPLSPDAMTLPKALVKAGYSTGCIGKWHVDGHGRASFIPAERRQGFEYWKVLECTHAYNHSAYYADGPEKLEWQGYDAIAQTRDAKRYIVDNAKAAKPFFLYLAWGPPHNPYETAPARYRAGFDPSKLKVRGNVPPAMREATQKDLAGYYAHCAALDDCMGQLLRTLRETGIETNTIVVFTSDHGDMLGSHGMQRKQKPYDESNHIPLLIRWPGGLGTAAQKLDGLMSSPDFMPTLLALCGLEIPKSVEGLDFSGYLRGGSDPSEGSTLITCPAPFGEWNRRSGGREYRGVRTKRYTYVRDLKGPWLLFDNQADPLQMTNLIGNADSASAQKELETLLRAKLKGAGDEFLPGDAYIKKWGYKVDANGTLPTSP